MLALGYAPTKHTVKFTAKTDLPRIAAVRLELIMDPNLPNGGSGRSIHGAGALTEFRVETAPPDDPEHFTKIKISNASADINLPETPFSVKGSTIKSGKPRVTGTRSSSRSMVRDGHRLGHRCRSGAAQSGAQGCVQFRAAGG